MTGKTAPHLSLTVLLVGLFAATATNQYAGVVQRLAQRDCVADGGHCGQYEAQTYHDPVNESATTVEEDRRSRRSIASAYRTINRRFSSPPKQKPRSKIVAIDAEHQGLAEAAQRTRDELIMRDNDIVIVSFPKSGTHWLTSVVANLVFPPQHAHRIQHQLDSVEEQNIFHGLPVFWMLPESINRLGDGGAITDETFAKVNSLPADIPRIFLSHQPPQYFEFEPTPKTTILYLMREPHAVWFSVLRWLQGLVDFVSQTRSVQGAFPVDDNNNVDREQYTRDFLAGSLRLPPRLREKGPAFTWHRHVQAWWNKVMFGQRFNKLNAFVVDFQRAMENPSKVIIDIARACGIAGWEANRHNKDLYLRASEIAKMTQYDSVHAQLVDYEEGALSRAAQLHFPAKSKSRDPFAWVNDFEKNPRTVQYIFNTTTATYSVLKDKFCYGEDALRGVCLG